MKLMEKRPHTKEPHKYIPALDTSWPKCYVCSELPSNSVHRYVVEGVLEEQGETKK